MADRLSKLARRLKSSPWRAQEEEDLNTWQESAKLLARQISYGLS
jgi:hypothetical protein